MQPVDGFEVATPAVTDDLMPGRGRRHRHAAPRLAGVDVADVDLDRWPFAGDERVMERVRRVRERAEVTDHGVVVELLEPIDQRALVVRLERLQQGAALQGMRPGGLDDLGQRHRPVDLRLAPAEGAEVGPVEDQDPHRTHCPPAVSKEPSTRIELVCSRRATSAPPAARSRRRRTPGAGSGNSTGRSPRAVTRCG